MFKTYFIISILSVLFLVNCNKVPQDDIFEIDLRNSQGFYKIHLGEMLNINQVISKDSIDNLLEAFHRKLILEDSEIVVNTISFHIDSSVKFHEINHLVFQIPIQFSNYEIIFQNDTLKLPRVYIGLAAKGLEKLSFSTSYVFNNGVLNKCISKAKNKINVKYCLEYNSKDPCFAFFDQPISSPITIEDILNKKTSIRFESDINQVQNRVWSQCLESFPYTKNTSTNKNGFFVSNSEFAFEFFNSKNLKNIERIFHENEYVRKVSTPIIAESSKDFKAEIENAIKNYNRTK